eukprot:1082737-Prorocentrum_minimum.AAC.2
MFASPPVRGGIRGGVRGGGRSRHGEEKGEGKGEGESEGGGGGGGGGGPSDALIGPSAAAAAAPVHGPSGDSAQCAPQQLCAGGVCRFPRRRPAAGEARDQSDEGRGHIPAGWTNRTRGEGIYLWG